VKDKTYPSGSYVIRAAQPFRAYVVDLLEPQKYPELRTGQNGPTKRPYDVSGWTLSYNMGVEVHRIDAGFEAQLEAAPALERKTASTNHRENASFLTIAAELAQGRPVRRGASGELLLNGNGDRPAYEISRAPRVALYHPYVANMDSGWTQFLLDEYRISYTLLNNADFAKSEWMTGADAVILADQSMSSILHGSREGEPASRSASLSGRIVLQRPEYTGGIGVEGAARLSEFVRSGGTLITFDSASELPVSMFPLPLRTAVRASEEGSGGAYYSPGSIIRIDVDPANPIAWGMPKEAYAFTSGGLAWDVTLLDEYNKGPREVRSVARYARSNLLASGWISGERAVLGRTILAEARHGKGRVVLFGFRPQFRAQSAGTFKFVLNAIYLSTTRPL
jgi:hypothetical protein